MNYAELNTVDKVAKFTKSTVQIYRQYPAKENEVIEELEPLFKSEAEGWKLVVDMGKFRNGFTRVLGVKGMKALRKLLYKIDIDMYQTIDFGLED